MREAVTRGYGNGGDVGGVFDFGPYLVKKMSSVLVLCKGGGAWPRWEEGNFKKVSTKLVIEAPRPIPDGSLGNSSFLHGIRKQLFASNPTPQPRTKQERSTQLTMQAIRLLRRWGQSLFHHHRD